MHPGVSSDGTGRTVASEYLDREGGPREGGSRGVWSDKTSDLDSSQDFLVVRNRVWGSFSSPSLKRHLGEGGLSIVALYLSKDGCRTKSESYEVSSHRETVVVLLLQYP